MHTTPLHANVEHINANHICDMLNEDFTAGSANKQRARLRDVTKYCTALKQMLLQTPSKELSLFLPRGHDPDTGKHDNEGKANMTWQMCGLPLQLECGTTQETAWSEKNVGTCWMNANDNLLETYAMQMNQKLCM